MTTQQDFLRSAMEELNLTPEEFSHRLCCGRLTLDRWLLPCSSKNFLVMADALWALVREILAHERSNVKR